MIGMLFIGDQMKIGSFTLQQQILGLFPSSILWLLLGARTANILTIKRMECENEAISTDHEGGAQYSLNFGPDDFCSYGEPKEGAHADDHD